MKKQIIAKQIIVGREYLNAIPQIKKRLAEIKEAFLKQKNNRIGDTYRLLREFVDLKKQINSKYGPRSLEWEKDFDLKGAEIRYIFTYESLSSRSLQLVEEDKISDATICMMCWRFAFLKEPQWQDKIVKMYLEGKIKISEIGEMTKKDVKQSLVKGKLKYSDADRYIISAIKTIRSLKCRLNKRGIDKGSKALKDVLEDEIKALLKEIKK